MSTIAFNETDHPRSRTSGQFVDKQQSAPEVALGTADAFAPDDASKFEKVREFARYYARRYNMDAGTYDDIVQDTILDVLGQQRRGTKHVGSYAFLNRATRAVASRYLNRDEHHTTLEGLRYLKEDEQALEQKLGRSLLPGERDRLADEVRMQFPAGNRPRPGFHMPSGAISLSTPVNSTDGSTAEFGDFIAAADQPDAGAPSAAAAALDALSEETITVEQARQSAWGLLTAGNAPATRRNAIEDDHAVITRIAELGGASDAASAWARGELEPDDEAMFFAAFDVHSLDDRRDVAEVFRKHAAYADDLFAAAVREATNPVTAQQHAEERAEVEAHADAGQTWRRPDRAAVRR